ncbi:hypothetical protein KKJ09_21740 [Xenorhabdus bovienii]|uniref:hypothetical protein n=1 Tax=Xenorhabdus bovienii TaxID=40576 RepID=UPI0023B231EC|nr:hypothetical protein [Xenorhabdus bovienii]MDE9443361.1 hypothetical protein [Xenorhabdus bovienii]MDE9496107.1 hypothetical protein [Xenorhabdus bovienii]MDE9504507.1 hypothetical protein [Xenorhabdus bovienii]MDE9528235.1 hypothetical protein [Xenorhabdus bovienii]MDE9571347.1 hypothetical protein [Xenorhabdus bovienii]
MKEESQKILVELLKKANDGIDAAVSFSQAQIPDVVQQLLVWNFASSLIFTVVGAVLFMFLQYYSWKVFKYLCKQWAGDDFIDHPEIMLITLAYMATFLPVAWLSLDWLKIWLAPKLYLLEYAASLIK